MRHVLIIAGMVAVALAPDVALAQLKIGVSWSGLQGERWRAADEPAIRAVVEAAGAQYIATNAESSAEKQQSDIEGLIARDVDALIVVAQDSTAIRQAVQKALDEDIPVIAYDRLIEMPEVLYVTFDNREVGRMQARALVEQVPDGNYVFIKGDPADKNTGFVYEGQMDVLREPIEAGAVRDVGDTFTDKWNPSVARRHMERFLTLNNDDIDAVVASNDAMAGAAIAALAAEGLAGTVAVSGQDGDIAALNRIALGTQTVSAWKDGRTLGRTAGEAALALARDMPVSEVPGATVFSARESTADMTAILLAPVPITRDNLDAVIDAGWASAEEICRNVPAGKVAVCG